MNNLEENRNISMKLRELRRSRGLTVDTLAKKMGENSQKVGRIERGTRSLTFDYLVKVSKALETPVESFLDEKSRLSEVDCSFSNPNVLTEIVMLVEKHCQNFEIDPHKKALMISKIYEQTLKFPPESRHLFLNSIFEVMEI